MADTTLSTNHSELTNLLFQTRKYIHRNTNKPNYQYTDYQYTDYQYTELPIHRITNTPNYQYTDSNFISTLYRKTFV